MSYCYIGTLALFKGKNLKGRSYSQMLQSQYCFLLNTFQILQSTAINEYKIESFKISPPSVK